MTNIQETTHKRMRLMSDLMAKYGGPSGVVPVISVEHFDLIEHKPGVVFEAHPEVAAKLVFKHTHRIATDEEHAQYRAQFAARTAELERQEAERRMRDGKFAVFQMPQGYAPTPATFPPAEAQVVAPPAPAKYRRDAEK